MPTLFIFSKFFIDSKKKKKWIELNVTVRKPSSRRTTTNFQTINMKIANNNCIIDTMWWMNVSRWSMRMRQTLYHAKKTWKWCRITENDCNGTLNNCDQCGKNDILPKNVHWTLFFLFVDFSNLYIRNTISSNCGALFVRSIGVRCSLDLWFFFPDSKRFRFCVLKFFAIPITNRIAF